MPSYKVVYFNGRGFAEPSRMILAHLGLPFEDIRYTSEEWPAIKPTVPMQQLPYLDVDGVKVPQSRPMLSYLAREHGLNGANNDETTKIEIVIATVEDLGTPLRPILLQGRKDEAVKKEELSAYYKEKAPRFLQALDKMLKLNADGDGFFVGSKISRADIFFYVFMDKFNNDSLLKESYPKLLALRERIAKDANIAAYLKKRPQTPW